MYTFTIVLTRELLLLIILTMMYHMYLLSSIKEAAAKLNVSSRVNTMIPVVNNFLHKGWRIPYSPRV